MLSGTVVTLSGDGMTNNMPDSGTLRWAIDQVNTAGSGTITFAVSQVTPTSPLPTITVPATVMGDVTINDYGLTFTGGDSTAQDLVIQDANDVGIYMTGANNQVLGDQVYDSGSWGVILSQAPSSTVGGTTAAAANVISGNQ